MPGWSLTPRDHEEQDVGPLVQRSLSPRGHPSSGSRPPGPTLHSSSQGDLTAASQSQRCESHRTEGKTSRPSRLGAQGAELQPQLCRCRAHRGPACTWLMAQREEWALGLAGVPGQALSPPGLEHRLCISAPRPRAPRVGAPC